jgi:hypothetical protein
MTTATLATPSEIWMTDISSVAVFAWRSARETDEAAGTSARDEGLLNELTTA